MKLLNLWKTIEPSLFRQTEQGGGADMGLMSTEEAIRAYEEILYNPNSSPEQKAVARIALESLRGY